MKVKHVIHSELMGRGAEKFNIVCPECGHGILTMRRNFVSLRLLDWDICPSCSTKFIFDDIEELRKEEGIWDGKRKKRKN